MPDLGKLYQVSGIGSPLTSRETLLAAALLERGFRLFQSKSQKNFQDVTRPDGERVFVFLFNGAIQIEDQFPGQFAVGFKDSDLYRDFEGGTAPIQALRDLAAPDRLVEVYKSLLLEIKTMPRHLEIHRGHRKYWLPSSMSREEREAKIAQLDKR